MMNPKITVAGFELDLNPKAAPILPRTPRLGTYAYYVFYDLDSVVLLLFT